MLKNRSRRGLVSVGLSSLVVLAACSGGSSGDSDSPDKGAVKNTASSFKFKTTAVDAEDVCTADKDGGTLNFRQGIAGEGSGLDPAVSQSNPLAAGTIYGTLMRWNDSASAFEGDLAESLTGNDDSTIWTLKLRDEVVYSDGKKLDAAAVKQNVERYLDPDYASTYSARVADIASMEVQDPQTLVFTLRSPWGTFPWLLTQNVGMIVNPAVLGTPDALSANPPENAGAGAFVLASYEPGVAIKFTGKDDWWGGPVCLDSLAVTFGGADSNADYEAFQAGQTKSFMTFDTPVIARADKDESLNLYLLPPANASTMQFNSGGGAPMSDVRVRQAVNYGMNRDLINSRVFDGLVTATSGIVPPDFKFAPSVEPLSFDEAKAKDLVKEVADEGVPVAFTYTNARTPSLENLGILTQALLKGVGITMKSELLQIQDWIENVYGNKNFDTANSGIQVHESCAYCALDAYGSKSGAPWQFSSPDMDAALSKLKAALPGEQTSAALDEVQTVWNTEMPAVIQVWLPQVLALDKSVHGIRFSSSLSIIDFSKVYVAG